MQTDAEIMFMDSATSAPLEQEFLPRLHPAEQSRYRGFTHDARRRSWLAGRNLMLAALARVAGEVDATALRTEESGSVRYRDGALHLSLSHSQDLMAVALSTKPVGLDIEWPRPRALVEKATRVYSEPEARWLDSLPTDEREGAFYTLWTLKEAACKALGLHLGECLRTARFDIPMGGFTPEPPLPAGPWTCLHTRLDSGFRLALVLRAKAVPPRIGCWRFTGSGDCQRETLVQPAFIYAR